MFRCQSCGALNKVRAGASGNPICGRCKAALDVSGAPQPVDGAALARAVASSPIPVLVDFWAAWCGPCRAVAPAVDELARENAGRLLVLKLDTEADPAAAASHRIQGIPAFVLFEGGRERARQSGAMPKQMLSSWIRSAAPGLAGGDRSAAP